MDPNVEPSEAHQLQIINAGLFRMATKSMAQAYIILGFKTHHGLLQDVMDTPWDLIEQAAEATWPGVLGASPRPPNTYADWEKIWGAYDAVTDLASPFAPQLIQAYPNAKVVIVQRDFEAWWPSFQAGLKDPVTKPPLSDIQAFITSRLLGIRPVHAMRKVIFGLFGAKSRAEINKERAREVYDTYFAKIRQIVPPERLLEYRLGSGWGPLCQFLGAEEPDVPFPQGNDKVVHSAENKSRHLIFLTNALKVVGPWALGFLAIGVALRYR
ncbi:hypothetical protein F4780DRAFT_437903 [Xylariomycetidae sp. FL0641]|nr:hypothetical protein F4780DRAFT_437903 [Xylariomycetidae sp. FL0641]